MDIFKIRGEFIIIKHDMYLNELKNKIENRYDYVVANFCLYSSKNRKVGEIDIIAFKNDFCDIYEVKCGRRLKKAQKQLTRNKKYLEKIKLNVRNSYFYYGENNEIITL
jgi:hypothetical protein